MSESDIVMTEIRTRDTKAFGFRSPSKRLAYEVRIGYSSNENRATNVPVIIHAGGSREAVTVNQRRSPEHGAFTAIGRFSFPAGDAAVEISNTETDGHVIADAIRLLPLK